MDTRELPGFPAYRISSDGHLETRWTWGPHYSGFTFPDKWRTVPPVPNNKGYIPVNLRRGDGTGRRTHIHVLVAETFVGSRPFPRACVRHMDGNTANNNADNLAWGTYLDNENDKLRHGTHNSRISNARLSPEQVRDIRARADGGELHENIARQFGVSRPTVTRIANRTIWKDA